jgi:drug/metabolite transporter (DMT)-like permease
MSVARGNAVSGNSERAPLIGVLLMMLVAIFNSLDAVIVRAVSPDIHPFVIGFTRAIFGLLVFLPWMLSRPGILHSHFRLMHVVRAALKLGSLILFFAAFAVAPLADVTAIAFTSPIFVTIGAWVFLSERVRGLRVLAVVAGFAGVVILLRPGSEAGLAPGLMLALLGSLMMAAIQLMLKPMSARDSTETLVAWNLILTVPIAAVPAVLFWTTPTLAQWGLLALQGAMGALAMALVTRAFALAEASLLVPFDFLRLPIVAGFGWLLFAQTVPFSTWAGGAVIFGASMLMLRTARR